MKKILIALVCIISFSAIAQQGYRYDIVPGTDNTYSLAHKEIRAISYAATKLLAPTMEETVYNFAQLTGAITITATITPCYTGDKMTCLFNANGTDRVVTFSTGFSAAGTLTVPSSTYSIVMFVFNGAAWYELSRQNNVSGSVTTLLAGNGAVGSPSISFTNDTDCGLYRIAANNSGFAENGAKVLDIGVGGLGVVGVMTSGDGTVSLPSVSFTSDVDCGLYRIGANNIGVAAAGAKVLDISATGLGLVGVMANGAGAVGAPAYSYTGQTNMGRYKISSTQEGQSISGALVGGWNASGLFTSSITEQVAGLGVTFAKQTIQKRTATAIDTTATVTAAALAGGLLTSTSAATVTMTLPTATGIATQIGAVKGTTFDFVVDNSAGANVVTVAVGSGIVASGFPSSNTLTLANSATVGTAGFRLTFISATAATLTRIN